MLDKYRVSNPNPEVPNPEEGWNDTYKKTFIIALTDDSVRQQRISTCESCDKFKLYFCTVCNCYMPFKTRIALYSCPEGKW